jgi:hypothetical protein
MRYSVSVMALAMTGPFCVRLSYGVQKERMWAHFHRRGHERWGVHLTPFRWRESLRTGSSIRRSEYAWLRTTTMQSLAGPVAWTGRRFGLTFRWS